MPDRLRRAGPGPGRRLARVAAYLTGLALGGLLAAGYTNDHRDRRARELARTRAALDAERAHVDQLRNVIALSPYARRRPRPRTWRHVQVVIPIQRGRGGIRR